LRFSLPDPPRVHYPRRTQRHLDPAHQRQFDRFLAPRPCGTIIPADSARPVRQPAADIAPTPPPWRLAMIVTVFRNRLAPDALEEYGQWADRMNELAVAMPGYISHKRFTADDGERVTIVEFESEEALAAWSRHPEHVEAKKKGRTGFYTEYKLQTCSVLRESSFPK
jgi:heme-degrading monooxygenase HmoA